MFVWYVVGLESFCQLSFTVWLAISFKIFNALADALEWICKIMALSIYSSQQRFVARINSLVTVLATVGHDTADYSSWNLL